MNDVLCPTDHTPAAEAAMTIGAAIAERQGGSLTLLHVLEKDHDKHGDALASSSSLMGHAEDRVKTLVAVKSVHREGDFMKEIAAEAAHDHSLMVVGTHGVRGLRQSLFGADILKLVRKVPIPTLVVQDKTPADVDFRRIVMPVASHADIGMLLDAVCRLAKLFGSEVHVYQVMRPGEQPSDNLLANKLKMLERLRDAGIAYVEANEPTTHFSIGFADQTVEYATRIKATTIAIMAVASDEYRWIADAEKERLLTNAAFIPVLCAV